MNHEEQEQNLAIIASFKDKNALDSAADHSCCNEDPDDGDFHAVLDGIYAGLGNKSKKEVWSVQMYEPGETESDFSTGLFYFFIDTSYENVLKRIEELPNLLKPEELVALEPEIRKLVPSAKTINSDDGQRGVKISISNEDYQQIGGYDSLPKKMGDIKFSYIIEKPKKVKVKK